MADIANKLTRIKNYKGGVLVDELGRQPTARRCTTIARV